MIVILLTQHILSVQKYFHLSPQNVSEPGHVSFCPHCCHLPQVTVMACLHFFSVSHLIYCTLTPRHLKSDPLITQINSYCYLAQSKTMVLISLRKIAKSLMQTSRSYISGPFLFYLISYHSTCSLYFSPTGLVAVPRIYLVVSFFSVIPPLDFPFPRYLRGMVRSALTTLLKMTPSVPTLDHFLGSFSDLLHFCLTLCVAWHSHLTKQTRVQGNS